MSEKISDFIKDLIDNANDRIKHPLISSFIFSWLIINWKIVFQLFSNKSPDEKISVIEKLLMFNESFLFPLFFGLFYVIILPFISVFFERLLIFTKSFKIENTYRVETKKIKEELKIVNKRLDLEEKRSKEKTIENLKKEIFELNSVNEKNNEIIKKLNREKNKIELERNDLIASRKESDFNINDFVLELSKTYASLKSNKGLLNLFRFIYLEKINDINELSDESKSQIEKLIELKLIDIQDDGSIRMTNEANFIFNNFDDKERLKDNDYYIKKLDSNGEIISRI
tara:strand:- start:610 stop:1464 length:855 start_codon:yes stop_codon:yes gene_type:complete